MIKWLLSGLEDAYSSSDSVWDSLEVEPPSPPVWDDVPSPPPDLLWRNCMWGGRCSSHDHGRCGAAPGPTAPGPPAPGQSVLKSSVLLRAHQPSPPPSPGREDMEMVLVSMTDVLSEVRWQAPSPASYAAPSPRPLHVHEDHSYHLTRHSRLLDLDHLGVQTPSDSGTDEDLPEDDTMVELPDLDADDIDFFGPETIVKDIAEPVSEELLPIVIKKSASDTESCHHVSDSEEEIDVVSVVVDKARTLPTNPSVKDRQELQQTVADAVGRRARRHLRHHHRRHRHHHRRHHRHHHRRRRDKSCQDKPGRGRPCHNKPRRGRPSSVVPGPDNPDSDKPGHDRTDYDSLGQDGPAYDDLGQDGPAYDSTGQDGPGYDRLSHTEPGTDHPDQERRSYYKLAHYKVGRGRGRPGRKKRMAVDLQVTDGDDSGGSSSKRNVHNNMERQRRIDLSNMVHSLRQLVPATSEKHRAPRIVVLREAAEYCQKLQVQATQLATYKEELQRLNSRLQMVHQLTLQNLPPQSLRELHRQAGRYRPGKKPRCSKKSSR